MNKNILILSASPRKGGNSETLCDQFAKGAQEVGHTVEKIRLHEQNISFCTGCAACLKLGHCVQNDDMTAILEKMAQADVIVLATPVYYYTMNAQMKVMIDRTLAGQSRIQNKEFYLIATAADGKADMDLTFEGLRGYLRCLPNAHLPNAKEMGVVYGADAFELGDIQSNPAMQEAYEFGRGA
ncbi:FMN-dependent NADH-azoreductase [Sporomusa silvacetica DSM 10669]|uniref:FMN-dependent NADH-azoreductase n=1 Tax=Sporomusa silvacetica DSM 10669 TaxID=1123289 RepID=A0ABZ3IQG4_9FIRM|nr:flavodoxin family protein [Sporomusa silvacetica]OZC17207.1 iron-sulfur flavoprotein [Sporomusa silvacetica DSM 10669]